MHRINEPPPPRRVFLGQFNKCPIIQVDYGPAHADIESRWCGSDHVRETALCCWTTSSLRADRENEGGRAQVANRIAENRDFHSINSQDISKRFGAGRQSGFTAQHKRQALEFPVCHLRRRAIHVPPDRLENRQEIVCVSQRIGGRGIVADGYLLLGKREKHLNENRFLVRGEFSWS